MAAPTIKFIGGSLFYSPDGRNGLPTVGFREVGTLDDLVVGENLVFSHHFDAAADLATPTTQPADVIYSESVLVMPKAYKLVKVDCFFSVKNSGASKLRVEKCTGTQLPGQGTALITNNSSAGFDLAGTAATVQAGVLVTAAATKTFAAGNRIAIAIDGTLSELADGLLTFTLAPVVMDTADDGSS